MAKQCLNIGQYSVVLGEMTDTMKKVVGKMDGMNRVTALRALRVNMSKKYNDLALVLDDAIKMEYGYNILSNTLKDFNPKRKELKDISRYSATYLPLNDTLGGLLHDFSQDKLTIDNDDRSIPDSLLPSIINGGININDGGLDNTLFMFNAAVGARISEQSLITIDKNIAQAKNFEQFYNMLKDMDIYEDAKKLPDFNSDSISSQVRIRMLKPYYLGRRPINRVAAERKFIRRNTKSVYRGNNYK